MKKLLCLGISVLLMLNNYLGVYGEDSVTDHISNYCNPAYEEYLSTIENLPDNEYTEKLFTAPSKYSYNEEYVSETNQYALRSSYPVAYNSIEGMSINYENIFNHTDSSHIGWSFAASDALEIHLRKRCYVSKEDCNFSAIRLMQQISSTVVPLEYAMKDTVYGTGDFSIAAAYWLRNAHSLENEKIQVTDTVSLSDLSRWSSDEVAENRINSIKKMVMDYGGVYAQCELFTGAFDQHYSSYNNNEGGEIQTGTHLDPAGIVIVGWDDNYAIDKFGESKPSMAGAFKVITNMKVELNSGTLQLGEFYLSYDMVKFLMDVSAVKKAETGKYAKYTYEYDKKAHSGVSHSNTTTNVYANKYIKNNDDVEKIKSITTYCEVPNSIFNVYISKDGNMENLQKVNVEGQLSNGYSVSNMGYVTMNLSEELIVSSDFAVAVEVKTPMTSAESIPQEIMPIDNANISGRCFVANTISDMKSGNYTDCGSRNNIIKAHVIGVDMQWKFDDSEFDTIKNTNAADVSIMGLHINGNISFSNSNKRIKGTTFYNYALMTKTDDYRSKSLSFYVNGPSKIYVIGKSNDESKSRRIAVYSSATGETGYITMSSPNGYRFSYDGGGGYVYLYSVDDSIRIYSVAVEEYYEEDWYSLDDGDEKKWQFADLYNTVVSTTGTSTISSNIEYNGMYLFADPTKNMVAVQNESTSTKGYRYYYGLDLEGSGSDNYRSVAFDVNQDSDLYITARTSGTTSGELYLTNKYNCDLDTDLNKDSLTISSDIVTYKVHYNGYGERVYLRSKDNGIRLMSIVVDNNGKYTSDEHKFEPSSINDLTVGSVITNKTLNDYSIIGTTSKPVQIVASTEAGYTKAIRLMSAEHFENGGKISFSVGDSRGTHLSNPVRKIRVKAKASVNGPLLVLADEYGYVLGARTLTTSLNEYDFDYSGDNSRLYLFTYYGGSQSLTDIYSISKTDINYYTDAAAINISVKAGQTYRYLFNGENVPVNNLYNYVIEYDASKLKFVHIGKDNSFTDEVVDNSIKTVSVSNGTIRFNIANPAEKDWSGIATSVVFEGIADGSSTIKFSANKK